MRRSRKAYKGYHHREKMLDFGVCYVCDSTCRRAFLCVLSHKPKSLGWEFVFRRVDQVSTYDLHVSIAPHSAPECRPSRSQAQLYAFLCEWANELICKLEFYIITQFYFTISLASPHAYTHSLLPCLYYGQHHFWLHFSVHIVKSIQLRNWNLKL